MTDTHVWAKARTHQHTQPALLRDSTGDTPVNQPESEGAQRQCSALLNEPTTSTLASVPRQIEQETFRLRPPHHESNPFWFSSSVYKQCWANPLVIFLRLSSL